MMLGALSFYLQSVKELFIDYRKYELKTKADTESLGIAQQAIEAAQVWRMHVLRLRHVKSLDAGSPFTIATNKLPCRMPNGGEPVCVFIEARLTPELSVTPQAEVQRLEAGRTSALTSTQVRSPFSSWAF